MYYVICKGISFILEDAIFEPLMMYSVVAAFLEHDFSESVQNPAEAIFAALPALERLRNLNLNTATEEQASDEQAPEEQEQEKPQEQAPSQEQAQAQAQSQEPAQEKSDDLLDSAFNDMFTF